MRILTRSFLLVGLALVMSSQAPSNAYEDLASRVIAITITDAEKTWIEVPTGQIVLGGGQRYIEINSDAVMPGYIYIQGRKKGMEVVYIGDPNKPETWVRYEITVVSLAESVELKGGLERLLGTVPGVRVYTLGDTVIIDGMVQDPKDFERIQKIAKAHSDRIQSLVTMADRSMILLQIDFVEVKRSELEQVGIRWENAPFTTILNFFQLFTPERFGLVTAPQWWSALTATDGNIDLNGSDVIFRTWETHTLVVLSGATNTYGFGSTVFVPIPAIGTTQGSLEKVEIGVDMTVTPIHQKDGTVKMDLDYRISDILDGDINSAFRTTRAEQSTTVVLREDEFLVVGGALKRGRRKSQAGIPGLRRIPVLGLLFGSKEFEKGETDSAIFITPRILRDASEEQYENDRIFDETIEKFQNRDLPL